EILDAAELQSLEPQMTIEALGATHYKCDGKLYPQKLMRQLIQALKQYQVRIEEGIEVLNFNIVGRNIREVVTNRGTFEADQIIIAAGATLPKLAEKLGVKMPIMPGKGYSFMYQPATSGNLNHAALLLEARVAVTPMANQIRFSGTMELGAINDSINRNRVKGILESIP